MKEIFSLSEKGSKEYSASVVKIGELIPIEGSDFLAKTVVDGEDIVVRKDKVQTGDLMIYARIETVLDPEFLKANNLYELSERERNSNFQEVQGLMDEGKVDEAKKKVGFFNKHGRVKMIRLRGCPSKGFLFTKESLTKWKPSLEDINLEDYLDVPYFDTIQGELFIKVYIPWKPEKKERTYLKKWKKDPKFDTLIPGQFALHYDTVQIGKEIYRFTPEDKVSISIKLHGTSMCMGNLLVKKPLSLPKVSKIFRKIWWKKYKAALKMNSKDAAERYRSKIKPTYNIGYGVIYSSRTVIKNQYINKHQRSGGHYGVDVWADYYKLIGPLLPKDYEIYGEIIGYISGSQTYIQKGFDYGCEPGENKLMIYRVSILNQETGKRKELDVPEVLEFTKKLVHDHPEIKDRIHPIDLMWNGTLSELYPDVDLENHWHEEVLERLKNDKEHFGLELDEPMCKNKVPREGIVIRKDGDPVCEAFKYKTNAYLFREQKDIDSGKIDIEMQEGYGDSN